MTILLIYAAVLLVAFLVGLVAAIVNVTKAKKDNQDDRNRRLTLLTDNDSQNFS